jgi:histidinol-phosphate phosphatase family protein
VEELAMMPPQGAGREETPRTFTGASMGRKAIFLDRDGVINEDFGWISSPEELKIYHFAAQAITRANQAGFLVIVVTNQSVIARELCTLETLERIHAMMEEELAGGGARVDAIFFCPHHPEYSEGELCGCRKPEAGLVDQAVREFGIEPAESYMIGDKTSDIQTGINAGMQTILVRTGKAGKDGLFPVSADWIEDDLLGAITRILHEETIASRKKAAG